MKLRKIFKNTFKNMRKKKIELLSNAPSLIYEEGDIIKRALRDIYDNETKYIYVDGNEGYQKTKKIYERAHA